MILRSFRVFWPVRFFVSFILFSIAISACATSPSSPVGVQTSPTTQVAKAAITWPFEPNDGQWAIVNGYRGNVDHAPGRSPNNYALFAFDFAKCLPNKVNLGNGSCDLTDGWANTVGATVYAPVSGTIAWPDDNCLGASISIDRYPGFRVVLFHIDPLPGTTWSQLAYSKPPKHFNQGDKIGTVSAGGCIGSGSHIHMALYSCTECVGDDGSQRVGHPFSDQWSIGSCSFSDDGQTLNAYLGLLVPCHNSGVLSPTLTPSPTATPTTPSPNILVQDSLKNTQTLYPGDNSQCSSKSDGYHVSGVCVYSNQQFGDVTITVHAELIKGGKTGGGFYGIDFREGTDEASTYYLAITTDGMWFTGTSSDTPSNPAIKQGLGTVNVLQVRMKGSHFDFFVNGTKVGGLDNSKYSSGAIGFMAGTLNEAVFTDLLVTALS